MTRIKTDGGHVTGVTVDAAPPIEADFYIAALPVERMASLLTDDLRRAAPSIANLDELQTRWMNGIQFYLAQNVPVVNGHAIYLDSPWALTSISQRQFWTGVDFSQFGNGAVRGILSVDISEMGGARRGSTGVHCRPDTREVWTQLKQAVNVGDAVTLDDANLGDVIAIQNGIMAPRVIRIVLARDEKSAARFDVLERGNPLFDGVTTGVVVGKSFYYMASIQDDRTTDFRPISVLALPL